MPVLTEDLRQQIRHAIEKYPNPQAATLPALHLVHDALRCVSLEAVREVAELLGLHPAQVHDTLSFYGFFRDEQHPLGRRRVWVCRSLSCMLRGGEELLAELSQRWGLQPGETTADGALSLEVAECLGACEGAPCMLVDDACHTHLTADKAVEVLTAR